MHLVGYFHICFRTSKDREIIRDILAGTLVQEIHNCLWAKNNSQATDSNIQNSSCAGITYTVEKSLLYMDLTLYTSEIAGTV
jgi:hypothetical protein